MKGIILSRDKRGCYVLDHQGSYRYVRGHTNEPVGAEIVFADTGKVPVRFASVVAGLLAICIIGSLLHRSLSTSYYLYIDAAPSVELAANSGGRIRSASGLNEEGSALIADMELRDMSSEDAALTIIREAERRGYTLRNREGGYNILLSMVSKNHAAATVAATGIKKSLAENGVELDTEIELYDADARSEAGEFGMSPAKLELSKELCELDPETSLDDLAETSVADILEAIGEQQESGDGENSQIKDAPETDKAAAGGSDDDAPDSLPVAGANKDKDAEKAQKDAEKQEAADQRDAEKAQKDAEKQEAADQRDAEKAQKDAEKQEAADRRDAEKAQKDAEKQEAADQRDADKAQKDAEKQEAADRRDADKAQKDAEKQEAADRRDAEKAQKDAEKQNKQDADMP